LEWLIPTSNPPPLQSKHPIANMPCKYSAKAKEKSEIEILDFISMGSSDEVSSIYTCASSFFTYYNIPTPKNAS
jgi:hypothetical protein